MNNLNDPPEWNIRPVPNEGPDWGKWNYALMVPMLGLAAFRWIWARESQRQIQEAKSKFEGDVAAIVKDLELKCKDSLTENQRTTALLELELEKARHQVKDYKKLALRVALQQEKEWQQRAQVLLEDLENQLVERQNAFCSPFLPRRHRMDMENALLLKVTNDPMGAELGLQDGIKDIFRNDNHCADKMNEDKRKNGKLMWLYLKYWRQQVTLQKHKRAEDQLKGLLNDIK